MELPIRKNSIFDKPGIQFSLLVILTVIAFSPSLKNGFINTWDDNVYITENTNVTGWGPDSMKEIFSKPVNGTYVPLPLLSFAMEYRLFGNNPLPFHITNLVLHILCTLLVFQLLRMLKMDVMFAAFGALLAAIHPMRVESVAWITERKDLLYSLFYLASMIFYIRSLRNKNGRILNLMLCLLFFILSLFSKIQAVSLPLSLFLIDYYFERPFRLKNILEKVPLLILSLFFGLAGIYFLQEESALKMNELLSLGDRVIYGFYALTMYLVRFLFPLNLSSSYGFPVPEGMPLPILYYLNPLVILLLAALVFWKLRHNRVIIFGLLFFLLNIAFMLQIFSAGTAFQADRFTYIPYVGLFFIAAWVLEKTAGRIMSGNSNMYPILVLMVFIYFGTITFARCQVWKNDEVLWSDVIKKYPDKILLAYTSRGDYYLSAGNTEKAIDDFTHAIRLNPKEAHPYLRRGLVYLSLKAYDKAISDYKMALKLDPDHPDVYQNLAAAYFFNMDYQAAINVARDGLSRNPHNAHLYGNIGYCDLDMNNYVSAIESFQKCLIESPDNLDALVGLSLAYYCQGDKPASHEYLQKARKAEPLLNQGMTGLEELARTGVSYTEKEKEIFSRMFNELN